MATGIQITPPSAITIGSTAISNGVEGRVLFQGAGDVVQQDSELFWDNTSKGLGIGATPASNVKLDVRAQATAGTVLRIRRNDDTENLFSISTTGTATFRTTQFYNGIDLFNGAGSQLALRTYANIGMIGTNSNGTINFTSTRASVGYGNYIGPQASLDVKAHGALSTDIAFRVRNSSDTNDFLTVLGTGDVVVGQLSTTLSNNKALRIDSSGFSKLHFNTTYNAVTTPTGEITINRRQATFVDDNVFLFSHRNFSDGNNKSYKTYHINPSAYYGSTASVNNEGYIAGWSWFRDSRADANRLMKLSVDGALNLYNRPSLPIEVNFVDSFQLYSADRGGVDGKASAHFRTEDGTVNVIGDLSGFGTNDPQARLDVRAQGALSTDVAFRVRNSADTLDILRITGNNKLELGSTTSIIGGGVGSSFISNISIGGAVRLDAPFNFNSQEVFNGQRLHFATTYETNGTRLIQMQNGTAPTTGLANAFKMYSADIVAGNAAPHFRTENGSIVKLYQETTGIAAAAFVANTSLIFDDSATYGGYTMGQVVAALKAQGLLA